MNSTTLEESMQYIQKNLSGLYPDREVGQLACLIVEHVLNYSKIDIQLKRNDPIADNLYKKITVIVDQLKSYKPIQYIFEKAHFFGFDFAVNKNVLVPRQETEELVQWITDDYQDIPLKILDVGTGSGCIAITLSKLLPRCKVDATDISPLALDLAKKNAKMIDAKVHFFEHDILNTGKLLPSSNYDVIVSNPPYVRESEKEFMHKNVLDYEPETALFVSDEDPLLFYRAIAKAGKYLLNDEGRIYCEINEALGKEVEELFQLYGYNDIEIRRDINGKERMVKAVL